MQKDNAEILDNARYARKIEQEEKANKIKFSDGTRKKLTKLIEKYDRQNSRIERKIKEVQKQIDKPTSFKEKLRNVFGKNQKLLEELEKTLSFNMKEIKDLAMTVSPEAETEYRAINIPELIVDSSRKLSAAIARKSNELYEEEVNEKDKETVESGMEAAASSVPNIPEIKSEPEKVETNASEDIEELSRKITAALDEMMVKNKMDADAEEAKIIAKAQSKLIEDEKMRANEPKIDIRIDDDDKSKDDIAIQIDDNDKSKGDIAIQIDDRDEAKDDSKRQFAAPSVIYKPFNFSEMPDTAPFENKEKEVEFDTYSAHVENEKDVNNIKGLIEEQTKLNEIERNNDKDINALENKLETGYKAIAAKKNELEEMKRTLLEQQREQKERIEKQNETRQTIANNISKNDSASSQLDADIETLKSIIGDNNYEVNEGSRKYNF